MGEAITSDHIGRSLQEGDRIVFAPGTPNRGYGFLSPEKDPHFHGGFSDYIALHLEETFYLKTELHSRDRHTNGTFNHRRARGHAS
jgi:hypothetical protein